MAPRRRSSSRPRHRSRQLGLEGLEGRRLLAVDVAVASEAGASSLPLVRLVDSATGAERASVMAFEPSFRGGVRVAMGHLTGNAAADIVVASGSGRANEIRVFKPVTSGGSTSLRAVLAFRPFPGAYRGGVEVAVGDVNGDGVDDIVASKSRAGGDVKVFTISNAGGTLTRTYLARLDKPFGAAYQGGSSVAVADVGEFANGAFVKSIGDNKVEIAVGSGVGIPARVLVYDVSLPARPRVADTITPLLPSWFQGGVSVASGRYDANGVADSIDEIVISVGRGGGSQTFVYDGTVDAGSNALLKSFAPHASLARPNSALFTAAVDGDGNGQTDGFLATQGDPGGVTGISNISATGLRSGGITALAGPLRIAAPRTTFQPRTISGIVASPSRTNGVTAGTARDMQIREIVTGSGAVASTWDKVTVQYTGMLTNGSVFDTSRQADRAPFELTLGAGQVIAGWEAGLVGMKVGGRRLLVIPPELGYGDPGSGAKIPGKSTLVFDVELVSVTPNNAATITGTSTATVTEDATPASVSGTLTATDPDDTPTTAAEYRQSVFAAPASLTGTYGTFTFNASTGAWGYTLDNTKPATQALTAGQTVTDSLAVTSRDGTASRTIVVTVVGANEVATITGTGTGSLTAGVGTMTTSGKLVVSDADPGQAAFAAPSVLAGTYGDFTFDASKGDWSYTLDTMKPATLRLTTGQTVTDSLPVASLDGTANRTIQTTIGGFTMRTTSTATRVVSGSIPVGTVREMKYSDIVTGTGATATAGKTLSVNYLGMLADGTVFNSWRSFGPLVLGAGDVIAGWDAGLVGMKVGGQRVLVIPPELGYGDTARTGIPAGSTLVFKVELLSVT